MSDHHHEIDEMRRIVNSARARWMRDTNIIVLALLRDAHMLETSLGDISYDEAVDSWERMAIAAIDTLRNRKTNDQAEKEL